MSLTHRTIFCLCLIVGTISAQQPPANANPNAKNQGKRNYAGSTTLAQSAACAADIQKYCVKKGSAVMPNLKVLQCIDDLDNAANLISLDCQNLIYRYKYNMTHFVHFDNVAKMVCKTDLKVLEECGGLGDARGPGRLAACLNELLSNITEIECRNYVLHLQLFTFSDWRLSEYFATSCIKDITALKCGRLDDANDTLPHDQGAVIACLSRSPAKLSKECSKEIFRLTEIQSNDYHLDRALYYACREDRERLCSPIQSGNGRIYRCLYEQKFNNLMTPACRKEIQRRQKLVAADARVDAPLIKACRKEAVEHKCLPNNPATLDSPLSLVNLLLCLTDRRKKGEHINDKCQQEMLAHRRMLMSDYTLSPEIISQCTEQMNNNCARFLNVNGTVTLDKRGGKMLHCLLNSLRKEKKMNSPCAVAVNSLLRATNLGNDIRADPLLEATCRPVIDALCSTVKPGSGNVVLCLLENLKHAKMTDDCEDRLMDVAYFMQRDWRITPTFVRSCKENLQNLCQLPQDWSMTANISDLDVGRYLSCLHEQRPKLTAECRDSLKRLMNIRAQSVGLIPEVEEQCIDDLSKCYSTGEKGQEMRCLQEKYYKLEDPCKTAVRQHTSLMMADPTLDFYLMKACEPLIQSFCTKGELDSEDDVLRCLIKQKNNPRMTFNCRASIEHHQITSLKDKAFLSKQFHDKCATEIQEHCPDQGTKALIVQCLANAALKDVLKTSANQGKQINEKCREELRFELLQRSENIALDPGLSETCTEDIREFCSKQMSGNAQVLECLKANGNKLSVECRKRLRNREKIDVALPTMDFSLTSQCGQIIQKFCSNENNQNILLCLRRQLTEDRVPGGCRRVLYHRLMIFNTDSRFNRALIENCQDDIHAHCAKEIMEDDNLGHDEESEKPTIQLDAKDDEMGGRVIQCLRNTYANSQSELRTGCVQELVDVIQTSKLDIKLDIKLYEKCRTLVESQCRDVDKEDCLKLMFQKKQITDPTCRAEVLRIVREGQADIHVDHPLVFSCQSDILKYCNDIPIGNSKQLKCLLNKKKSVSKVCQEMLSKRQEMWSQVDDVKSFNDLTRHITDSEISTHIFSFAAVVTIIIFLTGCACRSCLRGSRYKNYKAAQA